MIGIISVVCYYQTKVKNCVFMMVAFDTSAKIGAAMAHLTDYMDDPCNQ